MFRHDNADSGVMRRFIYALDHLDGGDDDTDGRTTFDVRDLSTWNAPAHPPFVSLESNTPVSRRAWRQHEVDLVEERAIKAAIQAALDKQEIAPPVYGPL